MDQKLLSFLNEFITFIKNKFDNLLSLKLEGDIIYLVTDSYSLFMNREFFLISEKFRQNMQRHGYHVQIIHEDDGQ